MSDYLAEGEKFIIVAVLPNGTAMIGATTAIDEYLLDWSIRYGEFLPVAAFRGSVQLLLDIAHIPRLPNPIPLNRAADLFHRAPIEQDVQFPVLKHIQRLGGEIAGKLLNEWRQAVEGLPAAA